MSYRKMREEARAAADRIESKRLRRCLRANGWSVQFAAAELGVSPSTLYRAIERHPALRDELGENSPPPGRTPAI